MVTCCNVTVAPCVTVITRVLAVAQLAAACRMVVSELVPRKVRALSTLKRSLKVFAANASVLPGLFASIAAMMLLKSHPLLYTVYVKLFTPANTLW